MKRAVVIGFTVMSLGGVILHAQSGRSADVELKAAQQKADVQGDLRGAIEDYKRIAARAGASRAVAAQALVQMAECYQKLGDAQARKIFEQVVRDYADQSDAAKTARARLRSLAARNAGITTRQVWTGPNVDTYGSVSADGRVISFTDWETGDLALHDLTTGRNRRLTSKKGWSDPAFAFGSAISRDGKRIAYGWLLITPTVPAPDQFGELRIIDVDGGKPRVLLASRDLEGVYVHDWSPDGGWLAVSLRRRPDRTVQIGLVSTKDGALRVLKSVDWRGVTELAFSPDGRYVAYDAAANAESEPRDVHVIAIDGNDDTSVVTHAANDRLLAWSPDGKHLLFASDRSGSNGAWALPIHDGKPQGEALLIRADINPSSLGLTRSGALYYGVGDSGSHMYVASADFETGRVLSAPTIIPKPHVGLIDFPAWSPDGKLLAYLSRRDSNSRSSQMTAVVIRSIESGSVRELRPELPHLNADNTRPLWTPDGRSLLVTATDRAGQRGIYRIDAHTGAAVPLVVGQQGRETVTLRAVSRDGGTLFIGRRDLKSDEEALIARSATDGSERELARRKGAWGRGTDVSPDGRTIAAGSRDASTGTTTLWLIPVDGGEPRPLLRLSPPEMIIGSLVHWSRDGKALLIGKDRGDGTPNELWRISAADGAARKVSLNADWAQFLAVPGRHSTDFHPDGQHVAFMMGKSQLEIWALENFIATLDAKR
jgi:Tol biopolymer transport system component